ncbi:NLI interacting factor-like phosphatase, putative [Plasmodium relictum]|uniref:NLI interacting factor-like phosphatase, putative n=1 Tax=Plasmodium relictum TaxID=85471 RepID=A0A1J1HA17_PLARL|nr:NLI interacting factor-like phosphatase, putative [Plasmodium relictum]CRH02296.1 NLI interacting factor-like phosphatase, putative [Plasmodium relictum]
MKKNNKYKNVRENDILKLNDNIYLEKLQYNIISPYFILNDNGLRKNRNSSNIYFILKKKRPIKSIKIPKNIKKKENDLNEKYENNGSSTSDDSTKNNLAYFNYSLKCEYRHGNDTIKDLNCNNNNHKIKNERSKRNKNLFKLLNRKFEHKKRNTNVLCDSKYNKKINVDNNNKRNLRKSIFVKLLRNSSKKILNSAEKVKILKNIFFKIKRKNDNLNENQKFVGTNTKIVCSMNNDNTCSKKCEQKKNEKNEKNKIINKGKLISSSLFLDEQINTHNEYKKRNILNQKNFKNNKKKNYERNIKSFNINEGKKELNSNTSNNNKIDDFKIKQIKSKFPNKNINSLNNKVLKHRKEYYYALDEGKNYVRMNDFIFLNSIKGRSWRPKRIKKFNKKKKNNYIISNIEELKNNKAYSNDNIKEYYSLSSIMDSDWSNQINSSEEIRMESKNKERHFYSTKDNKEDKDMNYNYINQIFLKVNKINKTVMENEQVLTKEKNKDDVEKIFKRSKKIYQKIVTNERKNKDNKGKKKNNEEMNNNIEKYENKDKKEGSEKGNSNNKENEKNNKEKKKNGKENNENDDKKNKDNEKENKNNKKENRDNEKENENNKKKNGDNEKENENNKKKNGDNEKENENNKKKNGNNEKENGNNKKDNGNNEKENVNDEKEDEDNEKENGNDEKENKDNEEENEDNKEKTKINQNKIKNKKKDITFLKGDNDSTDKKDCSLNSNFVLEEKNDKIDKKKEYILKYRYDKYKKKDEKQINMNKNYSEFIKKKIFSNFDNKNNEKKSIKEKFFFNEKNKSKIGNFISTTEIFNLYKKENDNLNNKKSLKNKSMHINKRESLEKNISLHNLESLNDSFKKIKNNKKVNEYYKDNSNLNLNKNFIKNVNLGECANLSEMKIIKEEKKESTEKKEFKKKKKGFFIDNKRTKINERIISEKEILIINNNQNEKCNGNTLNQINENIKEENLTKMTYIIENNKNNFINIKKLGDIDDLRDIDNLSDINNINDENSLLHKKSMNVVLNLNNCDNIKDEYKDSNNSSCAKNKVNIEDLITSVPKENYYNSYYKKKRKKIEKKIDIIRIKKKKLHSYFKKFRSFIFFANKKNSNSFSHNNENELDAKIKRKKFYLRKKKKIKKLKKLSLLNIYDTKVLSNKKGNESPLNINYENYDSNKFLLGQQKEKDKGKKTIVLDLDETLVHSTIKRDKENSFKVDINLEDGHYFIYVKKRPGVDDFFKEISKYYEVVIFTASLSKYANAVIDKLDVDNVCAYRLFRESCSCWKNNYVKDIKKLGRDLNNVIVIDNSTYVQKFCEDNCILIESWFDDATDKELYKLIPFLKKLSKKTSVICELRKYNKNKKKKKIKFLR